MALHWDPCRLHGPVQEPSLPWGPLPSLSPHIRLFFHPGLSSRPPSPGLQSTWSRTALPACPPASPAPRWPGSPPSSPAPGSSALGAVHPARVPSPGSVPALVPHRDQGQLPPLGPARLLQPLRGSRGRSPCRALIPVFAHPRSSHSPMVGAVEGASLQPGALGPFPALAPDTCGSWSLCTVSATTLPRTWSPVPRGVNSLPATLQTLRSGLKPGGTTCFLKFPFLLGGFCLRGPGGVQMQLRCVLWVSGVV